MGGGHLERDFDFSSGQEELLPCEGPGPWSKFHTSSRGTWRKQTLSLPCQEQRANFFTLQKAQQVGLFHSIHCHALIIQYTPGTVLDERYSDEQRSTLALTPHKFTI